MKKNAYSLKVVDRSTNIEMTTKNVDSSNKMWAAAKKFFETQEADKIRVIVTGEDGKIYKSFIKKTVNGNRKWWMHDEHKKAAE